MDIDNCPFCGGQEHMMIMSSLDNYRWVTCKGCRAEGPIGNSVQEAKELWNKRIPMHMCIESA